MKPKLNQIAIAMAIGATLAGIMIALHIYGVIVI